MKPQNNIVDPPTTMEEQSITDLLLNFNIESPPLNFDEFLGSTSEIINNSTVNNTAVNSEGNSNVNIDGLEELPILDDFICDFLNDSGNGEGNLSEDFAGNDEIHPIREDIVNPNHDQPPVSNNPCSACFLLREMVHTNGFRVMKLELHGEIGIINHVVLNIYDQGVAAQNPEFYMFDFSAESIFAVKNFLNQYCEMRSFEGYWLIPDDIVHFYDALSVGINSNLYMFSQPVSMESVDQTLFGSEQNSVQTSINDPNAMPHNIPANTEVGESSLQGANKGKEQISVPTPINGSDAMPYDIPANAEIGESSLQGANKGKEQISVLTPINGPDAMPHNIPANTEVGESSLQGAKKGKGKGKGEEKTENATQRERLAKMKLNEFNDLFDLPIKAAAVAMKVSVSSVKKKCRAGSVGRWPFRKIQGLRTAIRKKREALQAARTLHRHSKLSDELEKLEQELSNLLQDLRNGGISDPSADAET